MLACPTRSVPHPAQRQRHIGIPAALAGHSRLHSTALHLPWPQQQQQIGPDAVVSQDALLGPAAPRAAEAALYIGKHAVISGAGPCGSLSAMYLAQHGFTVDVYERRPPPPSADTPLHIGPRSFCIMLHRRGLEAIEGAGISLPSSMCLPRGRVVRYRGSQMYATEASPWSRSVNRDLLTSHLISEVRQRHPGRINFHFNNTLEGLNLQDRTAAFRDVAAEEAHTACTTVPFDFFIGADGSNSNARAQFAAQVPGFTYDQTEDDMEYKTILLPPLPVGDSTPAYFTLFDSERNAFFVCARDMAAGGQTRGVFVLNSGGFAALRTEADYYAALKASFPAPFKEEHYVEMSRQLVGAVLSHGNLNTHCSQIWGPSAVLLGDAAHSMWPTLGQGVNSALEDASVLSSILRSCKGDLSAVPKSFHDARHRDMLAVVDMTQHSYGAGKHAVSTLDIIKSVLQTWAAKVLPGGVLPRPALQLMNETNMAYSEIQRLQVREQQVLNVAAVVLGVAAAGVPVALLAPLTAAAGAAAAALAN